MPTNGHDPSTLCDVCGCDYEVEQTRTCQGCGLTICDECNMDHKCDADKSMGRDAMTAARQPDDKRLSDKEWAAEMNAAGLASGWSPDRVRAFHALQADRRAAAAVEGELRWLLRHARSGCTGWVSFAEGAGSTTCRDCESIRAALSAPAAPADHQPGVRGINRP